MQKAVPVGEGAMAALLGIELEPAQEACKEAALGEVVTVANDNGGGQVVVSGHKAAVERCIETAKPRGSKRGMLLPVSAPFHCPLMQPAADAMQKALETVALSTPRVPLVANVLAAEITEPNAIKQRLVEQVTGLVRWRESVLYMKIAGCRGAGRVRLGQGAVGTGQAHRQGDDRAGAEHAGGYRSVFEDGLGQFPSPSRNREGTCPVQRRRGHEHQRRCS